MNTTAQTTTALASVSAAPQQLLAGLVSPTNFPVVIDQDRQRRVLSRVEATNALELAAQEIALIGFESAAALNQSLDGFLSRIDKQQSPQVFELVAQLSDRVADENLGGLADRILTAKPPLGSRIVGIFRPKALREATNKVFAELARTAQGKSVKLADVIQGMENKLRVEMVRLGDELRHMDTIKASYRQHFDQLADDALYLHSLLIKARAQFSEMEPQLVQDVQRHQELSYKLQALESRALAVEGMFTSLPNDQVAIRLLQDAGVTTLQELATTASTRFASIRMTLLKINGALMIQNVQRIGQEGANLDSNLRAVGNKLMASVTDTAMNSAGNNRIQQARELESVVTNTKELMAIAAAARQSNAKKFEEARGIYAKTRQELLVLGNATNPGANVSI